jgi:hypothetical protein
VTTEIVLSAAAELASASIFKPTPAKHVLECFASISTTITRAGPAQRDQSEIRSVTG